MSNVVVGVEVFGVLETTAGAYKELTGVWLTKSRICSKNLGGWNTRGLVTQTCRRLNKLWSFLLCQDHNSTDNIQYFMVASCYDVALSRGIAGNAQQSYSLLSSSCAVSREITHAECKCNRGILP